VGSCRICHPIPPSRHDHCIHVNHEPSCHIVTKDSDPSTPRKSPGTCIRLHLADLQPPGKLRVLTTIPRRQLDSFTPHRQSGTDVPRIRACRHMPPVQPQKFTGSQRHSQTAKAQPDSQPAQRSSRSSSACSTTDDRGGAQGPGSTKGLNLLFPALKSFLPRSRVMFADRGQNTTGCPP
jgi:hypothetical protein